MEKERTVAVVIPSPYTRPLYFVYGFFKMF